VTPQRRDALRDDVSWITGLMRQNYDAVGFLPEFAIAEQYVANGRYVVQTDERGRKVGYLLHGKPTPGGILTVAQHCIETDKRLRGYGQDAFKVLLERARISNCRAIKVRCASDLPSNEFWQAMGLKRVNVQAGGRKRQRDINVMLLDLWPTLFEVTP
jgi:hypothetical protein